MAFCTVVLNLVNACKSLLSLSFFLTLEVNVGIVTKLTICNMKTSAYESFENKDLIQNNVSSSKNVSVPESIHLLTT